MPLSDEAMAVRRRLAEEALTWAKAHPTIADKLAKDDKQREQTIRLRAVHRYAQLENAYLAGKEDASK
jgi:hypothetical protein